MWSVVFQRARESRSSKEIKKDLLDRVADFYSRSRPESLLRALTRKYRRDV